MPEIASRAHLTAIVPVVERALADAGGGDVDAVAVTNAPGLVGALLVGVSYAKALAFARGIPVIGVHHMEGHLFATALEHRDAVPPFTALLVSGGHTLLLDVEAWGRYRLLGRTRDDAAGEAFDKVAKLLGLPYPGGPHVERLAAASDAGDVSLSRARCCGATSRPADADYYDVSFSGLKTAVLNAVKSASRSGSTPTAARSRAPFRIRSSTRSSRRRRAPRGSSAATASCSAAAWPCNATLVAAMRARLEPRGVQVFAPSPRLATDNAAMIARAGLFHLERGERSPLDLNAFATQPIPGLVAA